MTDFPRLLAALHHAGVRFIVVGGAAATAHGSARLTLDLDIVYDRSPDNVDRLVSALAPLRPYLRGAPLGLPFSFDAETLRRGLNFTLTTDAGWIDVLGEITGGGSWDQLRRYTVTMRLFGHPTSVIELTRLVEVKRAAGRPRSRGNRGARAAGRGAAQPAGAMRPREGSARVPPIPDSRRLSRAGPASPRCRRATGAARRPRRSPESR